MRTTPVALAGLANAARFRCALSRAQLKGWLRCLFQFLAPRLPHEMVSMVLAHVAAATLRDDHIPAVPYMELWRRWDQHELQGRAARKLVSQGHPPTITAGFAYVMEIVSKYETGTDVHIYRCNECHALIEAASRDNHRRWHESGVDGE